MPSRLDADRQPFDDVDKGVGVDLLDRRRSSALITAVAMGVLLTACGSRRPLADFEALDRAQQPTGAVQTQGPDAGTVAGEQPGQALPSSGGPAIGTEAPSGSGAQSSSAGSTGSTSGQGSGSTPQPVANFASDVGVTATTINLGNVTTKSGGFGEDQFTPFYYGAAAYFDDLNAHGGINGRKVIFNFCDDGGSSSGDEDCVRKFVDNQKVFSLVASVCLVCDGLTYASQKDIPFVGGVGIDFRDYALPHTYRYSGNPYPTNGQIGWKGKLYQPTFQYSFLAKRLSITKAGVVYYDNSIASKSQGLAVAAALRSVGMQVTEYPENVALPNYDSAVVDMKSRGITGVWDSLDIGGNQNLCKSINSNNLKLTAKVSTIALWSQEVASQFSAPCRNYLYSVEEVGAVSYDETSNPEIAKFRAAFKTYFPDRQDKLFQWNVDGWASAMWFTDAAASCGANLTRVCLEKYLSNPAGYSAHGLWFPGTHSVAKINFDTQKGETRCVHYAKWDDSVHGFRSIAPMSQSCGYSPYVATQAPS